jgi:hypothetical protein
MHSGLGSLPFARRYLGDRVFFLFLRLLRCFSSAGLLRTAMYSPHGDAGVLHRVSPFGHPRIKGYVRLPGAFRSLSRPSSALIAKASALRPLCLTFLRSRLFHHSVDVLRRFFQRSSLFKMISRGLLPISLLHSALELINRLLDVFYLLLLRLDILGIICVFSFQGTYRAFPHRCPVSRKPWA